MATHVKNMNELSKALQPTLLKITDKLADRVYETLNYFRLDYYAGCQPSSYQRTKAQKYSDTVECEDFFEKLDRRAIKLRYYKCSLLHFVSS